MREKESFLLLKLEKIHLKKPSFIFFSQIHSENRIRKRKHSFVVMKILLGLPTKKKKKKGKKDTLL